LRECIGDLRFTTYDLRLH